LCGPEIRVNLADDPRHLLSRGHLELGLNPQTLAIELLRVYNRGDRDSGKADDCD
jgi:hypothetical protein